MDSELIEVTPKLRALVDRTEHFLNKLLVNYMYKGPNEDDEDVMEDVMEFLCEVRDGLKKTLAIAGH
jgi:hypothetical protein